VTKSVRDEDVQPGDADVQPDDADVQPDDGDVQPDDGDLRRSKDTLTTKEKNRARVRQARLWKMLRERYFMLGEYR
jgi:hypothetical protein